MSGYVDLHLHYVPGVDDGVATVEDGLAVCRGLRRLGYDTLVATPHIRTAMFDNHKSGLEAEFARFHAVAGNEIDMPTLAVAAEHFFDDVFFDRFERGECMLYPGGHAALVELPNMHLPMSLEAGLFRMNVRGVTPVLAHPERYRPLFRSTDPIAALVEGGLLAQLDMMALIGHYGRAPRRAAERMLDEDVYYIAATDAHRPEDVPRVAKAIEVLHSRVGAEQARKLLVDHPRRILEGRIDR